MSFNDIERCLTRWYFVACRFSAEVFNGIQEEVTVTASRCQKLTSRVKRIDSALSPLEKAVLSQTSHIHFAYTAGMWLLLLSSLVFFFILFSLSIIFVIFCREKNLIFLLFRL